MNYRITQEKPLHQPQHRWSHESTPVTYQFCAQNPFNNETWTHSWVSWQPAPHDRPLLSNHSQTVLSPPRIGQGMLADRADFPKGAWILNTQLSTQKHVEKRALHCKDRAHEDVNFLPQINAGQQSSTHYSTNTTKSCNNYKIEAARAERSWGKKPFLTTTLQHKALQNLTQV